MIRPMYSTERTLHQASLLVQMLRESGQIAAAEVVSALTRDVARWVDEVAAADGVSEKI